MGLWTMKGKKIKMWLAVTVAPSQGQGEKQSLTALKELEVLKGQEGLGFWTDTGQKEAAQSQVGQDASSIDSEKFFPILPF